MQDQTPVSPASQKVSRTWIIAGVVIFLCCCLVVVTALATILITRRSQNSISTGSGIYNGLADDLLRQDILNAIAQYEAAQSGCEDVSIFSAAVIFAPDSSADGSWQEEWQVDVCGEIHPYSATFTPSPGGGTDFSITPLDQ